MAIARGAGGGLVKRRAGAAGWRALVVVVVVVRGACACCMWGLCRVVVGCYTGLYVLFWWREAAPTYAHAARTITTRTITTTHEPQSGREEQDTRRKKTPATPSGKWQVASGGSQAPGPSRRFLFPWLVSQLDRGPHAEADADSTFAAFRLSHHPTWCFQRPPIPTRPYRFLRPVRLRNLQWCRNN